MREYFLWFIVVFYRGMFAGVCLITLCRSFKENDDV